MRWPRSSSSTGTAHTCCPPASTGLRRSRPRQFETWVVDNASTDGSADLLRTQYPDVRVIAAPRNLGFAGGNNLALHQVTTPYAVLLNNDAVPEPDWLEHLLARVRRATEPDASARSPARSSSCPLPAPAAVDRGLRAGPARQPRAGRSHRQPAGRRAGDAGDGAVGTAHLRRARARPTGASSGPARPASCWSRCPRPAPKARSSWRSPGRPSAPRPSGSAGRAATSRSTRRRRPSRSAQSCRLTCRASTSSTTSAASCSPRATAPTGLPAGRRRPVRQPPRRSSPPAATGWRCATELGHELGWFDDDFFLYYEDTDLSWRMRARGYEIRYEPAAVLRHLHAASSQEVVAAVRLPRRPQPAADADQERHDARWR